VDLYTQVRIGFARSVTDARDARLTLVTLRPLHAGRSRCRLATPAGLQAMTETNRIHFFLLFNKQNSKFGLVSATVTRV
jgi:hypothetical protein